MTENEEAEKKEPNKIEQKTHEIVPAELVNDVPDEVKDLIKDLSRTGDREAVMRAISIVELFSGPLPHPRIMAQYKEVMPDAPDRIFKMAEKQQDHRCGLENKVIEGDVKRANTGLILGFILFIFFGVGGIILLALGKDLQGYIALGVSLLGNVGSLIKVGIERARAAQEQVKKKKRRSQLKPKK